MREVGLFFGSFNPIHVGHLAIANHILNESYLDEIVFILSPQNPFKKQENLLDAYQRLHLINLAIEDNPSFSVSDVEFNLPKPSYTGTTLAYLEEKYPNKRFSLIMGEDNLNGLHKWKNVAFWIKNRAVFVYPRIEKKDAHKNETFLESLEIHRIKAPILDISASYVRSCIQAGFLPKYVVPKPALDYIEEMGFYK